MARKGYKTASFTLPDGTRKYVYAKTQEELDEKVFNLKLQMKMGVNLNDKTTVGELVKLWYTTDVEGKIQPNTERSLKCVLNNHLMPLVANRIAKDVTPVQVKLWINEFNKLNKQSARRCVRALRCAFEIAEENGLVYKSPVLARYKAQGREYNKREALTPEQETALLDAVKTTRAYLFIWTALATGLRRGELLGLMWDCVDLNEGVIHVRRTLVSDDKGYYELANRTKTPAGQRTVPIPDDLRDALRAARSKSNSTFVFCQVNGKHFNAPGNFQSFWNANVGKCYGPNATSTKTRKGVVTDVNVTPHVLRHTYITRCFEAGMDIKEVQYLAGHESPQVTMEVYTHYCKEARQEATFEKARTARSLEKCTTAVPHKAV